MAFEQFPDTFYIKLLKEGVVEKLGAFSGQASQGLQYIVLTLLRVGTAVGTERLRLHLYSETTFVSGPVASSDWRSLSEFTTGTNAHGYLRFDFNREYLSNSLTYYLGIETENYTKTLSFYLAVKLDWPDDVYTAANPVNRGAQLRVIGYS